MVVVLVVGRYGSDCRTCRPLTAHFPVPALSLAGDLTDRLLFLEMFLPLTSILPHLTSTHGWSEDFIHHKLNQDSPSFSSSISTTTYLHTLQDQQNWWWGPQCIRYQVLLSAA